MARCRVLTSSLTLRQIGQILSALQPQSLLQKPIHDNGKVRLAYQIGADPLQHQLASPRCGSIRANPGSPEVSIDQHGNCPYRMRIEQAQHSLKFPGDLERFLDANLLGGPLV